MPRKVLKLGLSTSSTSIAELEYVYLHRNVSGVRWPCRIWPRLCGLLLLPLELVEGAVGVDFM
jgi:hypothetical protein